MFFSWGRHTLGGKTKGRIIVLRVSGGTSPRKRPVGGGSKGKDSSGSPLTAGKIK